ncbi:E3 ubiquitin-protein ligase TRIM33-like [Patella vulgata]|uniref:E3 ubiquitin-protein ligase TRIM33-like n=1 Tax=Patella vulgata TaxID=6465 RepID=UPI0021800C21|nr:E3 ubiquitin-protein ligase TRIM33-like [Patella vulgata]
MAEQTYREVCSICLNDFQEPKIIDCQHSFCYNCLEDYVHRTSTNGQFLCPLCRQNINLPEGVVKQMANNSNLQIQQCDVCPNIQATCRCRDCQQHLCDSCKSTHDKFVGCKGHSVVTIDEISKQYLQEKCSEIPDDDIKENISENSGSAPVHPADFCPKHSENKIEIHCKDCLVAVCFKCFVKDHNGHTFLDLQEDDVREKIKDELKTLKVEVEEHINKLQNHSISLQSKLSEVEEVAKVACANVDTHVKNICDKIHEIGENIKLEIQKTCNAENEKFTKLMTDIKSLTEYLQFGVKFSTNILENTSIVRVLERLPKVRQEADKCRSRKFNIPDIMYPSFTETEMNERVLRNQIGEVDIHHETRFIKTFQINSFRYVDGFYSSVTTFQGLRWYVKAQKCSHGNPGFYLCLKDTGRRSDILSCQVDYSLKLINHKDENKSVTRHRTRNLNHFEDHTGWGFDNFIQWDIFKNQESGFIDSTNHFNIQLILKLTDIKRAKPRRRNKHYRYRYQHYN